MSNEKVWQGAFPIASENKVYEGMTLRDWFAGQALASGQVLDRHGISESCYKIADAMLKEREK